MFVGGMCVGMGCGSGCACVSQQAGLLLHVDAEIDHAAVGEEHALGLPRGPARVDGVCWCARVCVSVSE